MWFICEEVLKRENYPVLRKTIDDERASFEENQIWDLVTKDAKII